MKYVRNVFKLGIFSLLKDYAFLALLSALIVVVMVLFVYNVWKEVSLVQMERVNN